MPVVFSTLTLENILCHIDDLSKELGAHYLADAILRSPVLLGSLDLLGNPTRVFSRFSRGLADFVRFPAQATREGPVQVIRAVGVGFGSLLQNISEGTLHSVGGFSRVLARNLENLSAEDRYTLQREIQRYRTPDGVRSGLSQGITSLRQSIIGAVLGVVSSPINGAKSSGAVGFFTGLGHGMTSVITKPMSGALDLIAYTSLGLASVTEHRPGRIPRAREWPGYESLQLRGAEIVKTENDVFVDCFEGFVSVLEGQQRVLVVFMKRCVLVVKKPLMSVERPIALYAENGSFIGAELFFERFRECGVCLEKMEEKRLRELLKKFK